MKNGINIETEDGEVVGASTAAATGALMQVIPSRVAMAAPGMIIPPLIMARLEKTASFIKNPWLKAPVTVSAYLCYYHCCIFSLLFLVHVFPFAVC